MKSTSILPRGWTCESIAEKAQINPKLPFKIDEDELTVSFIPMRCVKEESGVIDLSETRRYAEVKKGFTSFIDGDVIFAKITPCMENGKAAVVNKLENGVGFGSTEFHVIRAGDEIYNKYLFHFLVQRHIRGRAAAVMTGAVGQKRVPKTFIENLKIPLPPLLEQERIVATIEELFSELDKGVEQLQNLQKQLKVYRQSVLKYAFEGKLTAEWRSQNSNRQTAAELLQNIKAEREAQAKAQGKKLKPTAPLTPAEVAELPELPEGWGWSKLGEFIDTIEAGKSFRCDERPPTITETGVVKVSAVTWGYFDEQESKTCTDSEKVNSSYFINKGDFLFSRANTIDLVGACVIVDKIRLELMLSDKILRIIYFDFVEKKYTLWYLRSRLGRREIETLSTGNQESMRNIGQERIKGIRTPYCSLGEQQQIVQEIEHRLSIADQFEQTIISSLKQAEALRQSILKKAFSGELVTQEEQAKVRAMNTSGEQLQLL